MNTPENIKDLSNYQIIAIIHQDDANGFATLERSDYENQEGLQLGIQQNLENSDLSEKDFIASFDLSGKAQAVALSKVFYVFPLVYCPISKGIEIFPTLEAIEDEMLGRDCTPQTIIDSHDLKLLDVEYISISGELEDYDNAETDF